MNQKIVDGLKLILDGVTEDQNISNSDTPKTESKKKKAATTEVTVEDVRAILAEKSQDGLTGKVRELLETFGAQKLSAVDPEKLPELLEATKALE